MPRLGRRSGRQRRAVLGVFPVPVSVQAVARLVGQNLVKVIEESDAEELAASGSELHLFRNRPTSGSA